MEKIPYVKTRPDKAGKKFYQEDLHLLFPDYLNFYDTVQIEKTAQGTEPDFTPEQLQTYFDYCLSVGFSFQGEVSGHAIVQISDENLGHFPDAMEEFYALFIEVGNTILGHFLTELDKKKNYLSQLNAPFIFKSQMKASPNESIRKNRTLALLGQMLEKSSTEKLSYGLTYKNRIYSFHIVLFTQTLRTGHD